MTRQKLLKPRPSERLVLRDQELLRCPHVRYQATWCRRLCKPIDGMGQCGRMAPHGMKDRIQRAIARQLAEEAAAQDAAAEERG